MEQLVRDVLTKRYGLRDGIHYTIKGIPLSLEGAQELFNRDPHQFQHWVVELAGEFCSQKRSGDRGIDGRIYFEQQIQKSVLAIRHKNRLLCWIVSSKHPRMKVTSSLIHSADVERRSMRLISTSDNGTAGT